jgi:hypothetical protein
MDPFPATNEKSEGQFAGAAILCLPAAFESIFNGSAPIELQQGGSSLSERRIGDSHLFPRAGSYAKPCGNPFDNSAPINHQQKETFHPKFAFLSDKTHSLNFVGIMSQADASKPLDYCSLRKARLWTRKSICLSLVWSCNGVSKCARFRLAKTDSVRFGFILTFLDNKTNANQPIKA